MLFSLPKKFSVKKCYQTWLKRQNKHVLSVLVECVSTIASFNLWLFKGAHDVFALVVKFLGNDWMPKHITIGLLKASKTSRQALEKNCKAFKNNMA
jgi:hypothetical protein